MCCALTCRSDAGTCRDSGSITTSTSIVSLTTTQPADLHEARVHLAGTHAVGGGLDEGIAAPGAPSAAPTVAHNPVGDGAGEVVANHQLQGMGTGWQGPSGTAQGAIVV